MNPTRLYRIQKIYLDDKGWHAGQSILHDEAAAKLKFSQAVAELPSNIVKALIELGYQDCWPDAEGRLSPKGMWTVIEDKYLERSSDAA